MGQVFGEPTIAFDGDLIVDLIRPCVYAWVRGDQWLYVGKSMVGVSRVISAHHSTIRPSMILATDRILFWQRHGAQEIAALESRLIDAKQPLYNKAEGEKQYLENYIDTYPLNTTTRVFTKGGKDYRRLDTISI